MAKLIQVSVSARYGESVQTNRALVNYQGEVTFVMQIESVEEANEYKKGKAGDVIRKAISAQIKKSIRKEQVSDGVRFEKSEDDQDEDEDLQKETRRRKKKARDRSDRNNRNRNDDDPGQEDDFPNDDDDE